MGANFVHGAVRDHPEVAVTVLDAIPGAGVLPRRAGRREGADQPDGRSRARPEGASARSAGEHPYLTTPVHTGQAHELLGPTVFLAPEHKVVLTDDADKAREIGRGTVDFYLGLSNYLNNWKRPVTDEDLTRPGSDRFVDAVVAYDSRDQIAARLSEHLTAGADHVAIQVLGGPDELLSTLEELAGPLKLI